MHTKFHYIIMIRKKQVRIIRNYSYNYDTQRQLSCTLPNNLCVAMFKSGTFWPVKLLSCTLKA